jgi:hypothetical protein
MILRIHLDKLYSTYASGITEDTVAFETKNAAIDSFIWSDKNEAVFHVGRDAYKVSKHFDGRFFRLYGWLPGKGWQIRLVNVDKAIIKAFFGVTAKN